MAESAFAPRDVSLAIPTFERGEVLLDTLRALLADAHPPGEILVIDQTARHAAPVAQALAALAAAGQVRWLRLERPSITAAMNTALRAARGALVLFVDDDVLPASGLVAAHARAYDADDVWAVAGQVLQPGEEPLASEATPDVTPGGLRAHLDFPFRSARRCELRNVMAGNLSLRRARALAVGGFDENFEGVAYRFETEFARRLGRGGGRIVFEPRASLRHLRAPRGGTRAHGSHLTSASPVHGLGDYYFALREGRGLERWRYVLRRPCRELAARFYLRRPWFLPVRLLAELRAFTRALRLYAAGPRLLDAEREQA